MKGDGAGRVGEVAAIQRRGDAGRHQGGSAHIHIHEVVAAFAVAAPVERENVAARAGRELDVTVGPHGTGAAGVVGTRGAVVGRDIQGVGAAVVGGGAHMPLVRLVAVDNAEGRSHLCILEVAEVRQRGGHLHGHERRVHPEAGLAAAVGADIDRVRRVLAQVVGRVFGGAVHRGEGHRVHVHRVRAGHEGDVPGTLVAARHPRNRGAGGGHVADLEAVDMLTGRDDVDGDVVNVHEAAVALRDAEGDIVAVAAVLVEVHRLELPGAGGVGGDVAAHLLEGAVVVRVAHHTHLDVVGRGGLVGPEAHLQAVHRDAGVKLGRSQVRIVSAGAVEIDGIAARVVLGAGKGGVRRAVVGAGAPAVNPVVGAGVLHIVEVLRERKDVHHGAGGSGGSARPAAGFAAAADRTHADADIRVVRQTGDGVRVRDRAFGNPHRVGGVLQFPGGLVAAGRPGHCHAVVCGSSDMRVRGDTGQGVVAGNEELDIGTGRGGPGIRFVECRVGEVGVYIVVIEIEGAGRSGVVNMEIIARAIIVTGIVVHNQHEVVGAVILERRGEDKGVPALGTVQIAGIDLLQAGGGNVVRSAGEGGLRGVSQIDGHIGLLC